jgi:hypothetical protein
MFDRRFFGCVGGHGQVHSSAGQFRGNFAAGDLQTELFDQGPRWRAKSGPKIQDRHFGLEAKNIDETEDKIIVMRPSLAPNRAVRGPRRANPEAGPAHPASGGADFRSRRPNR